MCNLPLEMIEIHYREWPLPVVFCKLRTIFAEFFTCSSILTILAFTCERYFAIVHPIHFHQLSHFRRAHIVILIIWFISLIFSVPLGLSYEIVSHPSPLITKNKTNIMSYENMTLTNLSCESCVPGKKVEKLLSIIMIITSFCFFYFPMIIIGTIYLYIGKALRRVNKYEDPSQRVESSLSSLASIGKKQSHSTVSNSSILHKESTITKQEKTHVGSYSWLKTRGRCQARQVVVKTLVAVVIAFFVCYAPLYFQRLLSAIMTLHLNLNSNVFSNIMANLYVISGITFYFGSVINPILYNVVSNKYRRAFRDLFCCRLTYKTTTIVKQPRKFIQINRSNNQPIQYFVKKTEQQQQQQNSLNRKIDLNYNQQQQIDQLKKLKYPILKNTQSSKSNSSSISSHHQEHYPMQTHSLNSDASLPKKCQVSKHKKFSLRKKLLRHKQTTDTVPWLVTKTRA